jgi:hypothetical protein
MILREAGLPADDSSETADMFANSKLKPEKPDEDLFADESGDVELKDAEEGVVVVLGEEVVNAVRSRRRELRGCNGWKREEDIVLSCREMSLIAGS